MHSCISQIINSCLLKLGPGYKVLEFDTDPVPSGSLVIANLPSCVSGAQITEMLQKFGAVTRIVVDRKPTHCNALVCFDSAASASQAAKQFPKDGSKVHAFIAGDDHLNPQTHQNTVLKVYWKAPSISAVVHYDSFDKACGTLNRLDDCPVLGRRLKVTHHLSREHFQTFALRVDGLSPMASMTDIVDLLRSEHVSLYQRNVTPLEASTANVRALLEEKAPLKCFELLESFSSSHNICVKATYYRPIDAIEARTRLHGKRFTQTGTSPLLVHYNQLFRYNLSSMIFAQLKSGLEKLRVELSSARPVVKLRFASSTKVDATKSVVLEGEDLPAVLNAKTSLERILGGKPITSQNRTAIWHRFFSSNRGAQFLEECGSSNQSIIKNDEKYCMLRYYGPSDAFMKVQAQVERKLHELRAGTHALALRDRSLYHMLRGGALARLQRQFGTDTIKIDLLRMLLLVHGNVDATNAARLEIHNSIHLHTQLLRSGHINSCPICGEAPNDPIALACGHSLCKECLHHYLLSVREADDFPLRCLADSGHCKTLLPVQIIQSILSVEENLKLLQVVFTAHTMMHGKDFRFCPTPNCTKLYRPSQFIEPEPSQCSVCLEFICTYCHARHLGVSCREWRVQHDSAFNLWRRENGVKTCPNCGVNIERIDGCNHLACICGIHLCWQCLQSFRDARSVYEHMFREHGGIGIS